MESLSSVRVVSVTVDHSHSPLGVESARPTFGWILESSERGQSQSAYRILVSRDRAALYAERADCWDSGVIMSDRSIGVRYDGPPLVSRTRYHLTAQVRDGEGRISPWSQPTWFETGLQWPTDWSARWILHDGPRTERTAQLRKSFTLESPIATGRVYSTALGVYQLEINGMPVGNDRLSPGWTDYRRRVQYQVYDVTRILRRGDNAIGARLAPGWYAGRVARFGPDLYGARPGLLVQLEVTYADGARGRVLTDESWRSTVGPILSSDLLDGETYDARQDTPGWTLPGFDDSRWLPVALHDGVTGRLVSQADPPVRVLQELKPVRVTSHDDGAQIFDMGQNIVGAGRLKIAGGRRGDKVTLRFAEVLTSEGRLYTENLRSAQATDHYVKKGDSEENFEPLFTVHGFRYVEVTGHARVIGSDDVTGLVIGTDLPVSGEFTTSSALLNRLQRNIVWSQRGNFLSIPTDCPQRDERMGWTGDVNVYAPTAVFNTDCYQFLGSKWLADLRDAQFSDGAIPDVAPYVPKMGYGNAGWGDAIVTVPYVIWQTYGDAEVIEANYEAMVRWINYLTANSTGYLRPSDGWGDWLTLGDKTPQDLINTAYFARSSALLAEMAAIIGREDDVNRLQRLADAVRAAFARTYVTEDGKLRGGTQAAYVIALSFGLLPQALRPKAAKHLVRAIAERDWHLCTGFLATPELLTVLSDHGYIDVAYRLLDQRTCPSWGYQVERGATTIWEHWNSITPDGNFLDTSMNSFNHYANGSVGSWMYRTIVGINSDPKEPAFQRIIIRPRPGGGLTSSSGNFQSVYGMIESSWALCDPGLTLSVRVPVNATATVYLPTLDVDRVTEGDRPVIGAEGVEFLRFEKGQTVFNIGSGDYRFTLSYNT